VDEHGTSVITQPGRTETNPPSPGPRASTPQTPRRSWAWIVVAVVIALAGGGAYYYWEYGRSKSSEHGESGSADHKPASGLQVEVTHPRKGGIERTTTQAGSVHAFEHASLYSKVSGFLKSQNVDIGDRVKQGQLLAEIHDPEVDKAVEQSQAALDQAKAKVQVAHAKIRSAQAAREASQAMVKQAETMVAAKTSNLDLQEKQLRRVSDLVRRQAVEKKLQDEQQDRLEVAKADVEEARAEVLSNQSIVLNKAALIEEAQADLIEAEANVKAAQANLERSRVMQEYTRITSPYDGVVTLRSFHRGDFVRSASEGGNVPVLAVAVTDLMRIVLPVPDVDVPFVDKGDKATFQIVALPGRTFEGVVSRFSMSEDPESRNMRTEVDLPNHDGKLTEGMYGRVTIVLRAAAPDSVTIPSSGLLGQTGKGEGSVYVVRDGKAHKVEVQVGNDNGVETEILGGLKPDDQVITSYNGTVEEGTPVNSETRKVAQADH
jgi:HlyD family secretion protein